MAGKQVSVLLMGYNGENNTGATLSCAWKTATFSGSGSSVMWPRNC